MQTFTVTSDQFNPSLLNKSMNFFIKKKPNYTRFPIKTDIRLQQLVNYKHMYFFPFKPSHSKETMCIYFSEQVFGISQRVPSSQKCNPVIEGLANVEMKRPRDWNAAWRTCKGKEYKQMFHSL